MTKIDGPVQTADASTDRASGAERAARGTAPRGAAKAAGGRARKTPAGGSGGTAAPAGSRAPRRASAGVAMPKAPEPLPAAPPAAPSAAHESTAPAGPSAPSRAQAPRVHWVRQSCRLTTAEYGELSALKKRAAALARPMKRGRLLRAGLYALRGMSDAQLFALLDSLPDPEAAPG